MAGIASLPTLVDFNTGGFLLSQGKPPKYAYVFEVPEGHELDDVTEDRLSLG